MARADGTLGSCHLVLIPNLVSTFWHLVELEVSWDNNSRELIC